MLASLCVLDVLLDVLHGRSTPETPDETRMKIPRAPHRWKLTPRQAIAVQKRLAARIRSRRLDRPVRRVAGIDAAFSLDERLCIAGVVLWDVRRGEVLEQRCAVRPLTFPYVPGLLSFREAPAVLAALRKLKGAPDVMIYDGHGYAHPRRFGIACHVGALSGVPTIGCAKSILVGRFTDLPAARGAWAPLLDHGDVIGRVLRTQPGVRPVFVSVGDQIDLEQGAEIVLACATRYRLPEPTRLADQLVARVKRGLRIEGVESEDGSSKLGPSSFITRPPEER